MKILATILILCAAMAWPLETLARLGETEAQSRSRYGSPSDDTTIEDSAPLSAIYRTYTYDGWRITVAFMDGKAVRVIYAKGLKSGANTVPTAEEIAAILAAEGGEGQWKEAGKVSINPVKSFSNLFLKSKQWTHSSGNLAYLRDGGKILVVEVPNVTALRSSIATGKYPPPKSDIPKF